VAVTGLVVIAFLVPLFILVADLARDSAVSEAERDAESLARVLSVLTVEQDVVEAIQVVGEDRIADVGGSVVLSDGTVYGQEISPDEDLSLAASGSSFIADVDGGVAVYVPVLTTSGEAVVVRVFTPDSELEQGVVRSWVVLSLLGVVLVAIAGLVADRLGRTMVQPVNALATTANELRHGDLSARVEPAGPPEIEQVGLELNRLAAQIGRLLQAERETAADLAHRLRTPLTAAKLSIEGLDAGPQKARILTDLDDLERTVDHIIREARRPVRREMQEGCDLAAVVADRCAFWSPLAAEQERAFSVSIVDERMPVGVPSADMEAVIDALIENVLAHTSDGTAFAVAVDRQGALASVFVEDAGQGITDESAVERGASQGDSTGLGLDIVRRTVEGSGGSLVIGESRTLGGAGIAVTLPIESTS
jgi:signal transduction histidine kinase